MRARTSRVSPVVEKGAATACSVVAPGLEEVEIATVAAERSRLISRKHSGHRLSREEQDRLARLTARLTELLPPLSLAELQGLLEMVEEVESIRASARERRQRLALRRSNA
jgi:hypothetical protein